MESGCLRKSHWQVPITSRFGVKDNHRIWTIHWLNTKYLNAFIGIFTVISKEAHWRNKHIISVMEPVSRGLIQFFLRKNWRHDLLISIFFMNFSREIQ